MPNNMTDPEENRVLDLVLVDGDLLALTSVAGTDAAAGTEVAGGSYARQAIDWADAAGGAKTTAAAITFTGMPATDVQGWAVYNSAGTSRRWYGVLAAFPATAQASADTITAAAHGLADGAKVVFQSGFTPAGLTANTTYFVRDSTTNTFKVAATAGGTAIDLTADLASVVVGKVLAVGAGGAVTIATGAVTLSLS